MSSVRGWCRMEEVEVVLMRTTVTSDEYYCSKVCSRYTRFALTRFEC